MMTQLTKDMEYIFLLLLAGAVGVVIALYITQKPQLPNRLYLPIAGNYQNPSPTPQEIAQPTPTPLPAVTSPEITSQISPDGTKELTMSVTTNKDASKTYTFTTSSSDQTNQHTIYSVTYPTDTMSIPFNTWSPDDNYVFINHTTTLGTEALVLKANGEPFTPTESFFDITSLFTAKSLNNTYAQTTGWASNNLLIVNSNTSTNAPGSSYWFEVPTTAIIPLATQFY